MMAVNTPGDSLECVVVATVHMNIKTGVSTEIIELIVTSFTEKEILDAKTELLKKMGMDVPGGHRDTRERTAAYLYAKELVVLVHELDNASRLPKVVVSSDQLGRIPLGKKGISPAESVPISARMNDLENTVKKLCESFDKFRSESQPKVVEKTFADIAAMKVGTGSRYRGQGYGGVPTLQVTEPPHSESWADEMDGRQ